MPKSKQSHGKIKITLVKSPGGYHYSQREILRGLGLRKLNHEVIRENTPSVRGMAQKVIHLLRVEEVS